VKGTLAMWKKIALFVLLVAILSGVVYVVWPSHGFGEINYVGMTREQVIEACERYDRFLDDKIMIMAGPEFHYHSTGEEVRRNAVLMGAPTWGVNFKSGLVRTHYFVVHFENDVVVRQERSYYGDL
jgi:hypothetical protein